MKALVAGAGIGGRAAGVALREAGFEVQIFERSRELREIGAGLMIWPNGTRSLQALGVEPRALTVRRITFSNWHGRRLMEAPVDLISKRYRSDVAVVHRAHPTRGKGPVRRWKTPSPSVRAWRRNRT